MGILLWIYVWIGACSFIAGCCADMENDVSPHVQVLVSALFAILWPVVLPTIAIYLIYDAK